MNVRKEVIRLVSWYIRAKGAHSIHSPYVYDLYSKVVRDGAGKELEPVFRLRLDLLKDERLIVTDELGAGSRRLKSKRRRISDIARISCSSASDCRLLSGLARFYDPDAVIELGTCLGVGTAALCMGTGDNTVVTTFEGSPRLAQVAGSNFNRLNISDRIHLVEGNIDVVLDGNIPDGSGRMLAYIDANHRYEAVMAYTKKLISASRGEICLVYDDIRWSAGMYRAWQEIFANDQFRFTIDLGNMGIAFIRKDAGHSRFILRR